jgi:hypothetical protein
MPDGGAIAATGSTRPESAATAEPARRVRRVNVAMRCLLLANRAVAQCVLRQHNDIIFGQYNLLSDRQILLCDLEAPLLHALP